MEKIEKAETRKQTPPQNMGEVIDEVRGKKKRLVKSFINNKGFLVGVILVFIVIVVFTTDINFASTMEWMRLGLAFFVLLFCSYSMYVNCADSGTRAGRNSPLYLEVKQKYDEKKKGIVDGKKQSRLSEFCRWYIDDELQNTRDMFLSDAGLTYEVYKRDYLGKDEAVIKEDKDLSQMQIEAIIRANEVKPIKLTPDMIMKRGRGSSRRTPLGVKPQTKKGLAFGSKFVTTLLTSGLTGAIALNTIANPSWATFAELCLKLLLIILNGFTGWKMGYENIVVDTVNYMNDQIDLMYQFEQYLEKNPEVIAATTASQREEESPDNKKIEVETPSV
ncbi:MAG: hypothetical protein IJX96_03830 [Clostridia bacterium]|nr:hypothetical protein [Clostridia bacterium]